MSSQGGTKLAASEPTRTDSKRERRRGASGRASVLRRAPSDSDCSGETASLSADSGGDRAVRPPPPPPTTASRKRGRRRGSEWEVLEGLKDGQRFDKRPEVFNGYLHKKRKWPLKGWHKRFFVVDGGILVYARSPTDVARGRLHGSVDVGLSVISAKARRRRIDIDADEFIYHLRAKTPDVFRTWLNVLKAHRLYRQHLLTFGARESVPKIHAPEDLPATDTSSRKSLNKRRQKSRLALFRKRESKSLPEFLSTITNIYYEELMKIKRDGFNQTDDVEFNNYNMKPAEIKTGDENIKSGHEKYLSINENNVKNVVFDQNTVEVATISENKCYNDRWNFNSQNDTPLQIMLNFNEEHRCERRKKSRKHTNKNSNVMFLEQHMNPTSACFYFSGKKNEKMSSTCRSTALKNSKKSINLPKYKNYSAEPPIRKLISKCLLKEDDYRPLVAIEEIFPVNSARYDEDPVCVYCDKSSSEFKRLTDKLMESLYSEKMSDKRSDMLSVSAVSEIIKDLYNVHPSKETNPIILLFKCLLEYWIQNNSGNRKKQDKSYKSTYQQSDFTMLHYELNKNKVQPMSSSTRPRVDFREYIDSNRRINYILQSKNVPKNTKTYEVLCKQPFDRDPDSFEKDRRIQQLEKLLKNTVYACETVASIIGKENVEQLNKSIVDNLQQNPRPKCNASTELSYHTNLKAALEMKKIEHAMHLLNHDNTPENAFKDMLQMCIDIISRDSFKVLNKNKPTTSHSPAHSRRSDKYSDLSGSPTQCYEKLAEERYFSESNKSDESVESKKVLNKEAAYLAKSLIAPCIKNNKGRAFTKTSHFKTAEIPTASGLAHVDVENKENKRLVLDFCKFNLIEISISDTPESAESLSISIKLKEKSYVKDPVPNPLPCNPNHVPKFCNGMQVQHNPLRKSSLSQKSRLPLQVEKEIQSKVWQSDFSSNTFPEHISTSRKNIYNILKNNVGTETDTIHKFAKTTCIRLEKELCDAESNTVRKDTPDKKTGSPLPMIGKYVYKTRFSTEKTEKETDSHKMYETINWKSIAEKIEKKTLLAYNCNIQDNEKRTNQSNTNSLPPNESRESSANNTGESNIHVNERSTTSSLTQSSPGTARNTDKSSEGNHTSKSKVSAMSHRGNQQPSESNAGALKQLIDQESSSKPFLSYTPETSINPNPVKSSKGNHPSKSKGSAMPHRRTDEPNGSHGGALKQLIAQESASKPSVSPCDNAIKSSTGIDESIGSHEGTLKQLIDQESALKPFLSPSDNAIKSSKDSSPLKDSAMPQRHSKSSNRSNTGATKKVIDQQSATSVCKPNESYLDALKKLIDEQSVSVSTPEAPIDQLKYSEDDNPSQLKNSALPKTQSHEPNGSNTEALQKRIDQQSAVTVSTPHTPETPIDQVKYSGQEDNPSQLEDCAMPHDPSVNNTGTLKKLDDQQSATSVISPYTPEAPTNQPKSSMDDIQTHSNDSAMPQRKSREPSVNNTEALKKLDDQKSATSVISPYTPEAPTNQPKSSMDDLQTKPNDSAMPQRKSREPFVISTEALKKLDDQQSATRVISPYTPEAPRNQPKSSMNDLQIQPYDSAMPQRKSREPSVNNIEALRKLDDQQSETRVISPYTPETPMNQPKYSMDDLQTQPNDSAMPQRKPREPSVNNTDALKKLDDQQSGTKVFSRHTLVAPTNQTKSSTGDVQSKPNDSAIPQQYSHGPSENHREALKKLDDQQRFTRVFSLHTLEAPTNQTKSSTGDLQSQPNENAIPQQYSRGHSVNHTEAMEKLNDQQSGTSAFSPHILEAPTNQTKSSKDDLQTQLKDSTIPQPHSHEPSVNNTGALQNHDDQQSGTKVILFNDIPVAPVKAAIDCRESQLNDSATSQGQSREPSINDPGALKKLVFQQNATSGFSPYTPEAPVAPVKATMDYRESQLNDSPVPQIQSHVPNESNTEALKKLPDEHGATSVSTPYSVDTLVNPAKCSEDTNLLQTEDSAMPKEHSHEPSVNNTEVLNKHAHEQNRTSVISPYTPETSSSEERYPMHNQQTRCLHAPSVGNEQALKKVIKQQSLTSVVSPNTPEISTGPARYSMYIQQRRRSHDARGSNLPALKKLLDQQGATNVGKPHALDTPISPVKSSSDNLETQCKDSVMPRQPLEPRASSTGDLQNLRNQQNTAKVRTTHFIEKPINPVKSTKQKRLSQLNDGPMSHRLSSVPKRISIAAKDIVESNTSFITICNLGPYINSEKTSIDMLMNQFRDSPRPLRESPPPSASYTRKLKELLETQSSASIVNDSVVKTPTNEVQSECPTKKLRISTIPLEQSPGAEPTIEPVKSPIKKRWKIKKINSPKSNTNYTKKLKNLVDTAVKTPMKQVKSSMDNRQKKQKRSTITQPQPPEPSPSYTRELKKLLDQHSYASDLSSKVAEPSFKPVKSEPKIPPPSSKDIITTYQQYDQRAIDEKLVMMLLEDVAHISQNIPKFNKDIKNLVQKLKKMNNKHTKCVLTPGLQLLGIIYKDKDKNDELPPPSTFNTRQYHDNYNDDKLDKAVMTNLSSQMNTNSIRSDKVVGAYGEKGETDPSAPVNTNDEIGTWMPNLSIGLTETWSIDSATQTKHPTQNESTATEEINEKNNVKDAETNTQESRSKHTVHKLLEYLLESSSQGIRILRPRVQCVHSIKTNLLSLIPPDSLPKQEAHKGAKPIPVTLKSSVASSTDDPNEGKFIYFNKNFNLLNLNTVSKFQPFDIISSRNTSSSKNIDMKVTVLFQDENVPTGLLSPTQPTLKGPQAGFVSGTPGGRLAGWSIESGGPLESVSREIGQAQLSVQQLRRLVDALEIQQQQHLDTDVSLEGASPNVKKDRRKFGLRKKKSSTKCASVDLAPPHHIDGSTSHMALSALTAPPSPGAGASSVPNSAASLPIAFLSTFLASTTLVPCAAARPQSLPAAEGGATSLASLTPPTDLTLRDDFTVLAKDLVHSFQCILSTLTCERNRIRAAIEAGETATPPANVVAALRTNLTSALQQNSELRTRLSRIHDASDIAEISTAADPQTNHKFQQSPSYSSSCVSASEFFDAEEHEDEMKPRLMPADEAGVIELDGDSTSEAGSLSSEEGSASSDNSDAMVPAPPPLTPGSTWTRRLALPCPRPPAAASLWNLLYKNIGKDLSQVSMPVTINEPLNVLQRLCEELEYSELADAAAACADPVERMCMVAAFAVSAYAASDTRAASKPFNPLLHETYECSRLDRGLRALAEQVSHHPPVSCVHAESPRWEWWQDARIKTKFWGKSMEFQPTGQVSLRLLTTNDLYTWNKVTTCVHNLFGGQRWVDQYGDMVITCHGTGISCKLHFIKASSWSNTRHEVRGSVSVGGSVRLRLHGRWSEALYCGEPRARCLWRRAAMPPDYELYYGFTQFAMELNELEPGMRETLPPTDTRFRPDQRALEEGDIEAAEEYKMQLEQAQRDRRRDNIVYSPRWFKKMVENGVEKWVFTGEYWKCSENGFPDDLPRLW